MTPLTIIPITDATPGKRECATCRGMRMVPPADLVAGTAPACPACDGRGHTVTHDLTTGALWDWAREIERRILKGGGTLEQHFASEYQAVVGRIVERGTYYGQHWDWRQRTEALTAALDAIRPGDTLAHDGTELGRRCAAVVAKIALESAQNGGNA